MSWHSSRSRVPDERARSASEDPGPRGDTARSLRQMQVRASFTRVVASIRRFASLALGPGSRSARLRLAILARDTRVRSDLARPGRARVQRARRSGTQGRYGRSRRCCVSRFLRWVPGLVPLRYTRPGHESSLRLRVSRTSACAARAKIRDGGRHGAVAAISLDACRVTRRSLPSSHALCRYFPRCLSKKRAISLKASLVSGA
jgi:hypothetical protein